ncbi:glycerophosphodiester phosphodiesterase [Jiangella alkaliphila]|uniref:Glycerophosphoryl diester phosphodiesterase n=1 Tax=Jiangella alkaliphila TaxID=419479 RepID=A0A1H2JV31_9ACTN|nr:glycerophosphodiester phosphodiesterase family protein [Jiangella alkaliphila]SDU60058.1 glycerophosphoryl diester phosphodiesterase [Jiangella alkaliphila]
MRLPRLSVLLAAALPAAALVALPAAAEPATDEPAVVLTEDFSGGTIPAGWTAVEGQWTVTDGRLVGVSTSSNQLSRITFGPHLRNYRVEATVRFEQVINAARWAAVGLDIAPHGATPWWIATMRSGSTASNGLEFAQRTTSDAWNVTNTAAAPHAAGTGRDVRVAVEVRGSRATWIFDGQEVMRTSALQRSEAGVLGLLANGGTVSFDDVVVTELEEEPVIRPVGPESTPAVVAHRGYSSVAPENTLAAVESALRTGADYVEVDVASSADGVPIILHDNTLDRTTDGTGALPTVTSDYIDGLDAGSWFSTAFTGQPVPTLLDVLELMKGRAPVLLLEVKGPETYAELELIVGQLREEGLIEQTLLQSFDVQVLRDVRAIEPELRLGLLRSSLDADPVAISQELGVVAYNPAWTALQTRTDVVEDLHAAEIAVMPYTIDDPAQWAILRDLGVDGVITNKPGELVGWNARHVQTVPDEPTVAFAAPADGAELTRGDVLVPAVTSERAESIVLTLDGDEVAEGAAIAVDTLAAGEHTLEVTVTGVNGTATATTTVTVQPSAAGLVRLSTGPDVVRTLRDQLLRAIDRSDWIRVASIAESGVGGDQLPAELAALIAADARSLQAL